MAIKKSPNTSAAKQNSKIKPWLYGLVVVLVVAFVGILVLRLSKASTQPKILFSSDALGEADGSGIFQIDTITNSFAKISGNHFAATYLDQYRDINSTTVAYNRPYDKSIFITKIAAGSQTPTQSTITSVADDFYVDPVFSPDGKQIAFRSYKPGENNKGELVVADSGGAQKRVVSTANNCFFREHAWSPDSKELIVGCGNATKNVLKKITLTGNSSTETTLLDNLPTSASLPVATSPSQFKGGYLIAFIKGSQLVQIGTLNLNQKVIADNVTSLGRSAYSPDFRYLLYSKFENTGSSVVAYNFANQQELKLGSTPEGMFPRQQWSRDGSSLIFLTRGTTIGDQNTKVVQIQRTDINTFSSARNIASYPSINNLRW